ncbi:hematopoietic prostaglandin D synthase-like [Sycon ciliatum]|uniref:hematopoietic prostaglandin D synthase-like n=1 Tax=Sycon ciliatum TaxID=27933 RepID=UPI0031F6F6DF
MAVYKLTYFNGRGRAELLRYCLSFAGVEFEDNRLEMPAWPELKKTMMPDYLPALEEDGVNLHEGCLAAQYIACKYGFGGETDVDKHIIGSYTYYIDRLLTSLLPSREIYAKNGDVVLEKSFEEQELPAALAKLEQLAAKNEAGVLHGKSITQADIHFYYVASTLKDINPKPLEKTPALVALLDKVASHPRIKAWDDKRPKTKF